MKEKQIIKKLPAIIEVLRAVNKNDEIRIEFNPDHISITDNSIVYNWEVLEGMKTITDNPAITWSVHYNDIWECLEIQLAYE